MNSGSPGCWGDAQLEAAQLYLDLLRRSLLGLLGDEYHRVRPAAQWKRRVAGPAFTVLERRGVELMRRRSVDVDRRMLGGDWPAQALSMIGMRRLENLERCVTDVLRRGVPGDLIEAGVWRGGASILMRAILRVYGDRDRTVWVADSFRGLPPPDVERYPADIGDRLHTFDALAVPLQEVRRNFARYQLLDNQVQFLAGWFRDTLPSAPMSQLAVLRLDGDMYGSTMEALTALYPRVSLGGYVIVDDYGAVAACRRAVHDFFNEQRLSVDLHRIDWTGVYWRRDG